MSKTPVGASSASIRKAVNGIAKATGDKPKHTQVPSLDLEAALDGLPKAMQKKALEWYVRGIKRGMAAATDMMAARDITVNDSAVHAPKSMKVRVRTKFSGGDWESREIRVRASEIGFK